MRQRCVRAASLSHMLFSAAPPSVLERTIVSQRFQQPNFALPCTPPICSIEKPEMRCLCIDEVSSIIHKKFKEENIVIPYPQHTVHIEKNN